MQLRHRGHNYALPTIHLEFNKICAAEMAVRYAALAEKYMCVIVIR